MLDFRGGGPYSSLSQEDTHCTASLCMAHMEMWCATSENKKIVVRGRWIFTLGDGGVNAAPKMGSLVNW